LSGGGGSDLAGPGGGKGEAREASGAELTGGVTGAGGA